MKNIALFIFAILFCAISYAQSGDSLYVYKNGVVSRSLLRNEIDSVHCSKTGIDGTVGTSYVTQIIYSKGKEYKDALADIDSVSFSRTKAPEFSVYVVGTEPNSSKKNVAKIWKDGTVLKALNDGSSDAWVQNIAFIGNDYYSVGYTGKNLNATLWKNGESTLLPGVGNFSNATDITTDGNDYYISGYAYDENYVSNAYIWKNGKKYKQFNNSGSSMQIFSICKSGDNLFNASEAFGDDGVDFAAVYKDGTLLYHLTSATDGSKGLARRVSVDSNGDIYACGYEFVAGNGFSTAKVWKNGALLKDLSDGKTNARALWMTVENGHYYVCGYVVNDKYAIATVWKDGEVLYKMPADGNSLVNKLVVYNGDVYSVGYYSLKNPQREIACVWKNDKLLYNLTSFTPEYPLFNSAIGIAIKKNN